MAKQQVTKELKDLISSAGREEIAKLLKGIRQTNAVKVLCHTGSDEKTHSESDFWRWQIQVCTALLDLPKKAVTVEEEIDLEKMVEQQADNIEVGDVNELFKATE